MPDSSFRWNVLSFWLKREGFGVETACVGRTCDQAGDC